MNPGSFREAVRITKEEDKSASTARNVEVVLTPPFVFLDSVNRLIEKAKLGAQDAFWERAGKSTGEISAVQLKSIGVKYVIVGHSERRALGDTNEIVRKKFKSVLSEGLCAVLCVGEKDRAKEVAFPPSVREELGSALKGISRKLLGKVVIAYEPVWAVGTGKPESPQNVFEMSTLIRRELFGMFGKKISSQIPVLYGGSVDEKNAADFVSHGRVDGLLVGGASLNTVKFASIIKKVNDI